MIKVQNFLRVMLCFILLALLAGCGIVSTGSLGANALITPLPPGYLPTAIALTLEARSVSASQTATPVALAGDPAAIGLTSVIENTSASAETIYTTSTLDVNTARSITQAVPGTGAGVTPTPTASLAPSSTPVQVTLPPQPTATTPSEIPDAEIQIYRLGDLSRVTSPLSVNAYLTSHTGAVQTVELRGEDGRLLVRQVKRFYTIPWRFANLSTKLDYEIAAPAEVGRLIISVQDLQGRVMALNSVNLILLSTGEQDLNPTSALLEAIVIQEPRAKALITGGKVLVSGVARPDTDLPLRVELIDNEGRVVGQRLVNVSRTSAGGYGDFAAEVPYTVSALTPVRLVVYEDGENISPMVHLSSQEIVLSP